MEVFVYKVDGNHTGKLKKTSKKIDIRSGRWKNAGGTSHTIHNKSHPNSYGKPNGFESKTFTI